MLSDLKIVLTLTLTLKDEINKTTLSRTICILVSDKVSIMGITTNFTKSDIVDTLASEPVFNFYVRRVF